MALVVGLPIVITQELHRVGLSDVLRMILDELLDTIPERWNRLDIFVQADDEAVLLLVVLHELERVVVNVTEELNAWLDSPVPLVVQHERLPKEETRLESAHVSVAD